MFLALAGVTVIDFAAMSRHAGDETTAILFAGVFYGAANLGAWLGTIRGRRWGWILGALVGVQGVYVGGSLLDWWTHLLDPWAHVLPLLYTGGIGIAILVCLLNPAAIRYFWGRTTGKRLPLTTALVRPV